MFDTPNAVELWWTLAWKSTALLAAAGLAALALRQASAAARHFVWNLALVALLVFPPLLLWLPAWSWRVLPPSPAPIVTPISITNHQTPIDPVPTLAPPPRLAVELAEPTERPAAPVERPVAAVPPIATSHGSAWSWPAIAWAVGAALVAARALVGRLRLGSIARSATLIHQPAWTQLLDEVSQSLKLRRRVTLLLGERNVMPITWRTLRPIILLPTEAETWTEERKRVVLLHELAHIRRLDDLTQSLAQLACILYWFQPLAWLAASRMRAERERACDDLVLSAGPRPSDYAGHLLQIARELRVRPALTHAAIAMARPSQLEGRVLAILDPHRRRVEPGRLSSWIAVSLASAAVLLLATVRLQARPEEPPAQVSQVNATQPSETSVVSGRVVDPDGRAVANASVEVLGRLNRVWVGASVDPEDYQTLGQTQSDADGRFSLTTPRVTPDHFQAVSILAIAPDFAFGCKSFQADVPAFTANVKLHREQPVRFTLFDVNGMPAPGVEVRLQGVYRMDDYSQEGEGLYLSDNPPRSLRAWPAATTNDQGQCAFRGLPQGFTASLTIRDPRFARQTPSFKLGDDGKTQDVPLALEPARIIEGQVVAADTGRPIPRAIISAAARIKNEHANGYFSTNFRADADGRFQINPLVGSEYLMNIYPPAGEPYLIAHSNLKWVEGNLRARLDVKLDRGVLIRGKVTDAKTGQPLPGASVQFLPRNDPDRILSGWQAIVASDSEGVYQIAVPAGQGHLLIFGPTSDYVLESIGGRVLRFDKPGGERHYAHKILAYEARTGPEPLTLDAPLRPAKPVTIQISGPNGQSVTSGLALTPLEVRASNPTWRGDTSSRIVNGRYTLRGLADDATAHLDLLDDEHEWGASIEVSGKQADTGVSVSLQPCGTAKLRLVNPEGKPLVDRSPQLYYIATPGPPKFSQLKQHRGVLTADDEWIQNLDRRHYWDMKRTDDQGRVSLPSLIPGALYRITDFSTVNDRDTGEQIRRDFRVKPGETLDLGDILIEKPNG